jgi:hypothetical protein
MTMDSGAYQAWRELVKLQKPSRNINANVYWVAILYHNKTPNDGVESSDFIWIKCAAVGISHRMCLL